MMLSRFESQDSNKRHGDIGRKVMALEFWKVFGKVSAHSLFFAGRPRNPDKELRNGCNLPLKEYRKS